MTLSKTPAPPASSTPPADVFSAWRLVDGWSTLLRWTSLFVGLAPWERAPLVPLFHVRKRGTFGPFLGTDLPIVYPEDCGINEQALEIDAWMLMRQASDEFLPRLSRQDLAAVRLGRQHGGSSFAAWLAALGDTTSVLRSQLRDKHTRIFEGRRWLPLRWAPDDLGLASARAVCWRAQIVRLNAEGYMPLANRQLRLAL